MKLGIGLGTAQLPVGSSRTAHTEYRDIIELLKWVEARGLDGAWVSEHHGERGAPGLKASVERSLS
ncbi:MAG: LLM class flavin-dependent oxidoreductase [Actinomycetota bacterium]|nr:LLM class flavin-dependent oxidoreductase [Actinomycetota bacterium]